MTDGLQSSETKVELRNLAVVADEALARGSYASIVSATLADHECTIDFIATDAGSLKGAEPRGFLVARVIIANSNLAAVAELLNRQVEILEGRARKAD